MGIKNIILYGISAAAFGIFFATGCGPLDGYKSLPLPDAKLSTLQDSPEIHVICIDDQKTYYDVYQGNLFDPSYRIGEGKHLLWVVYRGADRNIITRGHPQVIEYQFAAGKMYTFGYGQMAMGNRSFLWTPLLVEKQADKVASNDTGLMDRILAIGKLPNQN